MSRGPSVRKLSPESGDAHTNAQEGSHGRIWLRLLLIALLAAVAFLLSSRSASALSAPPGEVAAQVVQPAS